MPTPTQVRRGSTDAGAGRALTTPAPGAREEISGAASDDDGSSPSQDPITIAAARARSVQSGAAAISRRSVRGLSATANSMVRRASASAIRIQAGRGERGASIVSSASRTAGTDGHDELPSPGTPLLASASSGAITDSAVTGVRSWLGPRDARSGRYASLFFVFVGSRAGLVPRAPPRDRAAPQRASGQGGRSLERLLAKHPVEVRLGLPPAAALRAQLASDRAPLSLARQRADRQPIEIAQGFVAAPELQQRLDPQRRPLEGERAARIAGRLLLQALQRRGGIALDPQLPDRGREQL